MYSNNFINSTSKYRILLIQGTGPVRAGQWARSVCTKEGLITGSTLPQLEWAENYVHIPSITLSPNEGSTYPTKYLNMIKKEIGDEKYHEH